MPAAIPFQRPQERHSDRSPRHYLSAATIHQTKTGNNMKKLGSKKLRSMILLGACVSLVSLASLQPASAYSHRHHPARGFQSRDAALAGGYRSGPNSWFNVDRADRASSPYAGGGGI